jgi:hypothetical protein
MKRRKITSADLSLSLKNSGYLESIGANPKATNVGRPRTKQKPQSADKRQSKNLYCKDGESRVTYIVSDELQRQLKAISYTTGQSLKNVVNSFLSVGVDQYIKKNGKLQLPNAD